MTKIIFYKEKSQYVGLLVEGHTGFALAGNDILCSAISSLTQSLALGILKVLKISAKYHVDESKGKLELRLPLKLDNEVLNKAQVLFETTYLSIKDLSNGYPSNIKMEVKNL